MTCRPDDVSALADAIAAELAHIHRHGPRPDRWHPHLAAYERRHLAHDLAGVVERILGIEGLGDRPRARTPLRVA